MGFDLNKLAPWNWFKKEQEAQQGAGSVPVAKANLPASAPLSSLDPLLQLHREVDRLFDDAFRGFGGRWPSFTLPTMGPEWQDLLRPSLDIHETDQQYRITLEVPGVDEKDIQLTLDDDVLWIRGEKRQEQEQQDGQYHRIERNYGSFQRALNLPGDADQDAIKASFKNGVLTVTIGKREHADVSTSRKIPIEN
ncbi:Hsp20/alpha crystallin family protein [Thioalkalivibrio sp.]|uniref:Hsp20/alpha crystallin family protein n=1 Tax=Thioalkalivibrio sp. TaxID=2093813 RepID=UPI003564E0C8